MATSIEVLSATAKHSELLARLHTEIFPDEAWPESWFVERLKQRTTRAFLAEFNRQPVGLAVLSCVLDEAEILTIGVVPAFRGNRLGKALLKAILSLSVQFFCLDVAEDNAAAMALYKSAGFVENGRRPNYYSSGADAVLMMLSRK